MQVEATFVPPRLPFWRRVVACVVEHELVLALLPVGAVILVNQLSWQWVIACLGIIPLTWIARWVARGQLTVRTPLDAPIAMLAFMIGIALYPSVDWGLTLPILAKMIAGIGLFYAIVNTISTERGIWVLTIFLLLISVGIAIISLINTSWNTTKLFTAPSLYSKLPQSLKVLNPRGFHPNIVGGTLGMLIPLHLTFLFWAPWQTPLADDSMLRHVFSSKALRLLVGGTVLITGGTLVLSQSRGALIGVMIALFILAIWRSRWALLLVPAGTLGILLTIRTFGVQSVIDFLLFTDVTRSSQGRLELWQRAIYMMQDFPYTGIGLGTFARVMPVLYPTFLIGPDVEIPHAHNLYLQMGVDLGIPGLVAYMAIVTAFLAVSVSAMRRTRHSQLRSIAVGTVGGYTVYLIHGLVDNITFSAKPATVLWALMGLTMVVWLYSRGTRGTV